MLRAQRVLLPLSLPYAVGKHPDERLQELARRTGVQNGLISPQPAAVDREEMIVTKVYRISRTELARIASEEYLRTFWWIVAPVPIAGILAIVFGAGPLQA